MSIKIREVKRIAEAALAVAEKAGATTPESRAMIISAAIDAVYRPAPRLDPEIERKALNKLKRPEISPRIRFAQ